MASKRRANGEGGISKRADGRWMGRYTVLDNLKIKRQRAVYGKTKAETATKLREAIRNAELGQDINKPAETLRQFYDYWVEMIAKNELKLTTVQSYDHLFQKWILPSLGKKRLNKLSTADIQLMIHGISQQTGAKTCKNCREALSSVLRSAVNLEKILTNPARKVSLPKYSPKEKELWNMQELRTFLKTAEEASPYSLAYKILACCGLRRGEVLGLRKSDIDFENAKLHIKQQVVSVKNKPTISSPKTAKSKRDIFLPAELSTELDEFVQTDTTDNPLVFHTKNGTPILPNNFERDFKKTIRLAGVKKIPMHSLRHMYCTRSLEHNASLKSVQDSMGHASPQVTIAVYQHTTKKDEEAIAKGMLSVLDY